jgi:hypothetical protein
VSITQARRGRVIVAARDAEDWRRRGLCRNDPDLWTGGTDPGMAAHICGHCPVLRQCKDDLKTVDPYWLRGVVQAGVMHNDRGDLDRVHSVRHWCSFCSTDLAELCPQCGGPMPEWRGVGKPRKFCRPACTQAWHNKPRRATGRLV